MAGDPPPLFRQRNFTALWLGQLISILGDRLTYVGLGGLVLEHTERGTDPRFPLLQALLAQVMLAPVLAFAPFTGAWVDRMNLRRVLIVSDLVRTGLVWLIPVLYLVTHHTGVVLALVFLMFTCNVFFLPAKSAITPEIVPPQQLLTANSWLTVAGIVATGIGMPIGGWVVDHWGWATAMRIDAITYLVSVGTLALVRYQPHEKRAAPPAMTFGGYLREVLDGWRAVRDNGAVALGLLTLAAVWIGGGFLHVAGNTRIQRAASAPGMERVGVLVAALMVGTGIGTWWVNTHGRRHRRPLVLGSGLVLVGLALIAFAVSTRYAVFAISALLVGLFVAPAFVLSETLIQEGTELHQRGRVFSLRDFLMRLAFFVSVTVAAPATRAFGTRATLLLCAGLIAAAGLVTLAWGRKDPALAHPTTPP